MVLPNGSGHTEDNGAAELTASHLQREKEGKMLDISNVLAAFSEEQVHRVTGLTGGRLRYWARTGFFQPSFVENDPRAAYSRFYSFKDVVALHTLEMLRVKNGVPLQHLRKVAEKLSHLKDDLWTTTTLYVANRKVVFSDPASGKPQEVVSGQFVMDYPLVMLIAETSKSIDVAGRRSAEQFGKVSKIKGVNRNAWTISGTRIPIVSICRLHED
ncbi:MAG TPA: MerR family transcriptional regulator, partial [Stellaceae bacterium]|nr:MerR family transcriptional regulator [Stellaceae bacterium]